jgi:hypothetical protein
MDRSTAQRRETSAKRSQKSRVTTETTWVDGYNTTLAFCQHTGPDLKATALKLASRLFNTGRYHSVLDGQSRIIVCLGCRKQDPACTKKLEELATSHAKQFGLQFFISIESYFYDPHGKPTNWAVIKQNFQPENHTKRLQSARLRHRKGSAMNSRRNGTHHSGPEVRSRLGNDEQSRGSENRTNRRPR